MADAEQEVGHTEPTETQTELPPPDEPTTTQEPDQPTVDQDDKSTIEAPFLEPETQTVDTVTDATTDLGSYPAPAETKPAAEPKAPSPKPVAAPHKPKKPHPSTHSSATGHPSSTGPVAERRSSIADKRSSHADRSMTTGVHYNRLQMTPGEEYALFRRRNHVSPHYKGPIYIAEDIQVPCSRCGGPLDPITRVPVGKIFFHASCVACALCDRKSITEPYVQVGDKALCSDCATRGYADCVLRDEAAKRGLVLGAIKGDVFKAFKAYDEDQRARGVRQFSVNQPSFPGATPPSLNIGPIHNRRNTTARAFALMQRQQYYTQNDCNLLIKKPPEVSEPSTTGARRRRISGVELPRLM